jgi:putative heme-binding domain-containing protein
MSEDDARVSNYGLRSDVHRSGTYRLCSVAVVLGVVAGTVLFPISQSRRIASAAAQTDKLKDPQFIAEGAKLFAPSCGNAYCHGSGGVGGGAPRLRGKSFESPYLFKTISNGVSGTAMLSFKGEFSEEQIWKLVAFVMSDVKSTPDAKLEAAAADKQPARAPLGSAQSTASTGSVQAGRSLFFDSSQSKSCHQCHSFQGEGLPIGPDLSKVGSRSPRDLFVSIALPRDVKKDTRYSTLKLTLRSGDKVVGIKTEEDGESIRVYDTTELPAVLRTIQKTDVVKLESANESVMPKDYASIYTMKQFLDLVTFLKSSESKSPVTLKDLLE